MSSTDCPSHKQLLDFVLGRTNGDCADRIALHAHECSRCRQTLDQLDDSTDDLLAALRQPLEDPSQDASCRRMLEQSVACIQPEASRSFAGQLPQTLRDYELLEPIGHGGMGNVYRAIHKRLKRIVAVKVIASHRLQNPSMLERFAREMETVGQLDHPHIVRAMDAGEAEGVHYLVMELLEGLDSQQLVHRVGALPVADACFLLVQAIDGLHYAHQRGLVHRDIKPSNLFVTTQGQLRILDFGLARLMDGPHNDEAPEIAGSLDYMPPEQLRGETLDHRADVYALGVTLYFWLTKQWPGTERDERSLLELSKRRWAEPIIPVRQRRAEVPVELEGLLQTMLAADAVQRTADLNAIRSVASTFTRGADPNRLLRLAGCEAPASATSSETLANDASPVAKRPSTKASHASIQLLGVAAAVLLGLASWKFMQNDVTMSPPSQPLPSPAKFDDRPATNADLAGRECFQIRIQSDASELLLASTPGEGVWVRQQQAPNGEPPYVARAWDLLELKIREPKAFELYQQNWPSDLGQAPLPAQLPLPAESPDTQRSVQWRHVSWPMGHRRVETLTAQERVVAYEDAASQDVIFEIHARSTETAKQMVARSRDSFNDEASQQLLNQFWTPWLDEQ